MSLKIQKWFIWPTKPKIKSKTIPSDFKDRGLKNVDINKNSKPSVLLDKKTLWWLLWSMEINSLKLIKKSFGDELKFHSNLSFNNSYIRHFPCFYKNILLNCKQYLSTDPETISGILSKNLWFNKHIIIDISTVNFT